MSVILTGPAPREGLPAVDVGLLRSRARRLLCALRQGRSELSIVLADDARMRELNGTWRGRHRSTDVLSFSLLEGEAAEYRGPLLGDVVIGIEAAARRARARHRALDGEVARLLIHGTLHLLGFDHQREQEARRMRAEERRLWGVVRGG
jgi:probable rRNA maturation factor